MREKHFQQNLIDTNARITPAYAGKTVKKNMVKCEYKDHPRVCGKNSKLHLRCDACTGSPPRMREKLGFWLDDAQVVRITPAYAGKTKAHKG